MGYCKVHDRNHDEEACPFCQDDLVKQHPELGPMIKRLRFWDRATLAYATITALIVAVAYFAFMTYREYVIWSR